MSERTTCAGILGACVFCAKVNTRRGATNAPSLRMLPEIRAWLDRAHRLLSDEDRRILLSPPRLVARFMEFALVRSRGKSGDFTADDVTARDEELLRLIGDLWRVLARYYFRLRIEGIDNVPATGPVLFVGNHSGGFLPSEGFFTAIALHDRFGFDRVPYALAHDVFFEDPTLRRVAARLGILRANHESAHRAFEAGKCVLVYPGSDMDTFRSFRDRGKIVLAGRKGFLRLALRERVPIVPIVDAGTHEQLIVVARGDRLAQKLHAHRWARTEVLPLVLSFPWGLTSGFVPYLPLPAQTTLSFLPPITPTVDLDHSYAEVEAAMQAELDRLQRGRRFLRGQPGSLLAHVQSSHADTHYYDPARVHGDGPRGKESRRDDARYDDRREQAARAERHGPA